jgi:hypothetical protein
MGVDVAGVVFYSELFPNHIRAKGVCLSMATVALTDLVYLQVTTTAFARIGWRFYLVFIVICGVGVVGAWIVSFAMRHELKDDGLIQSNSSYPKRKVFRSRRWRGCLEMRSL